MQDPAGFADTIAAVATACARDTERLNWLR